MAHNVCKSYLEHGAQYHRDYFINALKLLYPDPVLQVDMPSSGRIRFVRQPKENRYVLHLLYATPIQRGRTQVIEDLPPVYEVKVKLQISDPIRKVYLAPSGESVNFTQSGGRVELVVPRVECHQIVVFDY